MVTKEEFKKMEKKLQLQNKIKELDIEISLKGQIYFKYIKCSRPGCHCEKGFLHGPYPHLQWWEDGKIKTKYLNRKIYKKYKEELEKNHKKEVLEKEIMKLTDDN